MKHSTSSLRALWIVCIVAAGLMPLRARADLYIIVNASLKMSVDDIKSVYSGDKELIGSVKVKPTDNKAAQGEFLSKVLGLNVNRYDSLWTMKSFRDGLTAPASKMTDAEVLAFVQSVPGSIGYVTTAPPDGVVVLKKF